MYVYTHTHFIVLIWTTRNIKGTLNQNDLFFKFVSLIFTSGLYNTFKSEKYYGTNYDTNHNILHFKKRGQSNTDNM